MSVSRIFDIEIDGAALIVAPRGDVSTLVGEDVNAELVGVLQHLEQSEAKHAVIDLEKAAFFGSSMLGAMTAIWYRIRKRDGKMALCNVSDMGLEILHVSKFDTLWPICNSRQEALQRIAG